MPSMLGSVVTYCVGIYRTRFTLASRHHGSDPVGSRSKTAPVISLMAGVLERKNKMYIMPKAKLERIRMVGIKVLLACW